MQPELPDYYATLDLDSCATTAQIRTAYRFFVKQHHPDLNPTAESARIQQLIAAYEILSDPAQRRVYDRARNSTDRPGKQGRGQDNISQDAYLRVDDFLRGISFDVAVKDPANPGEPESYQLTVPPMTAPGTKFRFPRGTPFESSCIEIRVRVRPGFRFKVSGSNLRVDLRISAQRAANGGSETITGAAGSLQQIKIPARVRRGEILRVAGEGLPKIRGGRGDLLVRVVYRPEVRISRAAGR